MGGGKRNRVRFSAFLLEVMILFFTVDRDVELIMEEVGNYAYFNLDLE